MKSDETVFVVHHSYEREDVGQTCLIGVYSSRKTAEAAVERLRGQPGFCDYPECFTIQRYALDQDHWTEGFITLAPVQVKLLAGPEEWTTVHAELLHHRNCYKLIRYDDDSDEDWQFKGGDIVTCEERDGLLYAVGLAERQEK